MRFLRKEETPIFLMPLQFHRRPFIFSFWNLFQVEKGHGFHDQNSYLFLRHQNFSLCLGLEGFLPEWESLLIDFLLSLKVTKVNSSSTEDSLFSHSSREEQMSEAEGITITSGNSVLSSSWQELITDSAAFLLRLYLAISSSLNKVYCLKSIRIKNYPHVCCFLNDNIIVKCRKRV